MKKLLLILFSIFLLGIFNEAKSQLSFQAKKMTKEPVIENTEASKQMEAIEAMVTVNCDTTEIEIKFKNATIKEKIGKLYSKFEDGDYFLLVYEQNEIDKVILHFEYNALFSVVFQTDTRRLTFE